MVDLCRVNPLECNHGQCAVNISANQTYCQCDSCYEGSLCKSVVWKQTQVDTDYVYLIIFIIGLCFSLLNNGLCLELFIRCKRIRRTNTGVYLIIYCILSIIANILLVADSHISYYPNQIFPNEKQKLAFGCVVYKIGYNLFVYLCIWFSSCVAFERGLVIFGVKMHGNRWRSLINTIVIFAVAIGCTVPLIVYQCDWDHISSLKIAHDFFVWFFVVTGIVIYIVATLLVFISFTRRIHRYGTENGSRMKTYLRLLYRHLFIFIPPITYGLCYIPYTIAINTKDPKHSYFQCGISTGEYSIKVIIDILRGVPYVVTWLLFIFPSKVHMTEYYLNTWSGRCLAKIIPCCKSCSKRKKTNKQ